VILTDREIKIYIRRKLIVVDPEPEDIAYQSTAVDLRLDPTVSIFTKPPTISGIQQFIRVDPADPGFKADEVIRALTKNEDINPANGYPLEPGLLILGWTKEFVDLRQSRLAARVEGKSSLARLGLSIHLTAPTIHAGFQGRIRLEIVNHGHHPIILRSGMRNMSINI
jgi:dCTP deaminase